MKRSKNKVGLPPGSVVFTGNKKVDKILIHYLKYNTDELEETIFDNHAEIVLHKSTKDKVDWYDIRGIHDVEFIESFGRTYQIHPLILEDVANVRQRPKFEEYETGNFITLRSLSYSKEQRKILSEQVAIFFKEGFLVSFQETASDLSENLRIRVQKSKGKIRQNASDYLAYAIMDSIVDNYYLVLDEIEVEIESIEEGLVENNNTNAKVEIHELKKELLNLRKSIAPVREAVAKFSKSESPFVKETTTLYLRDLYDHTIQILDVVESYRDLLNGLYDLFMNQVSYKMNQVMQLLTLIATIFIPLTFLAGIYGMNFDHMPELHWRYSYFVLIAVMIVIFVGLLIFFKRKKWL